MSKVFIEEDSLTAIGNAIRSKTGDTAPLSVPTGMVEAIGSIAAGGSSGGGGGVDINSLKRVTSSQRVGSIVSATTARNIHIKIPKNAVFGTITFAARLNKTSNSTTTSKVYPGSACFIIQNGKIILYSDPTFDSEYIHSEVPTFFSFNDHRTSGVSTVTLPAISDDNTYHLSLYILGHAGYPADWMMKCNIPNDLYITSFVTE